MSTEPDKELFMFSRVLEYLARQAYKKAPQAIHVNRSGFGNL